jgi:peptidoglycan hydrolase-like protein with peptidoglycan-binding domain
LRSKAIVILLALSTALALWAATPAKKTKPARAKPVGAKQTAKKASTARASKSKGAVAAPKTTGKKAAASKKSTSSKRTASKKTSRKTSKSAAARYRRSAQREPDPERYKEIQRSLADKGYFAGPVDGTWGPDSVEALKRFQRDQNIDDDGKLGSLSLIALGLGPKRGAGVAEKPDAPAAGGSPLP